MSTITSIKRSTMQSSSQSISTLLSTSSPTSASTLSPTTTTSLPMSTSRVGIPGVPLVTTDSGWSLIYTTASATNEPSEETSAATGLSPKQLIGIYVGGGVACISFLVILLVFYLRSRSQTKKKQQRKAYFGDAGEKVGSRPNRPLTTASRLERDFRRLSSRLTPLVLLQQQRSLRDLESKLMSSSERGSLRTTLGSTVGYPSGAYARGSASTGGFGSVTPGQEVSSNPFYAASHHRNKRSEQLSPIRSPSSHPPKFKVSSPDPIPQNFSMPNYDSPYLDQGGLALVKETTGLAAISQGAGPGPGLGYPLQPPKVHTADRSGNGGSIHASSRGRRVSPRFSNTHLVSPLEPSPTGQIDNRHLHEPVSRRLSPVREIPSSTGTPIIERSPRSSTISPAQSTPIAGDATISEIIAKINKNITSNNNNTNNTNTTTDTSSRNYSRPDTRPSFPRSSSYSTDSPTLPRSMPSTSTSSLSFRSGSSNASRHVYRGDSKDKNSSSLLVKRRGGEVADRMGNELSISSASPTQSPPHTHPKTSDRNDKQNQQQHNPVPLSDTTPDILSPSSSQAKFPYIPRYQPAPCPYDFHILGPEDEILQSPQDLKVTPTKFGTTLYLNVD
ncbi:hypothetical protein FQN57_003086 [Myotisia sp. PD_48]|nr:hypothetical protein FQN57_003086 [Myotisia sp. PD_48]